MVDAIRDALEVLRRAVLAGFDRLCPESLTEIPLSRRGRRLGISRKHGIPLLEHLDAPYASPAGWMTGG